MKRINLQRNFIPLHFTKLLALTLIICMMSCVTAQAEDVTYVDENGNSHTVNATAITTSTNPLSEGWYVVNSTIATEGLTIAENADVRIILANGGTLTITASGRGIECVDSGPGSLYIYGVGSNSGTLNINSSGTGINVWNYTQNGGTVSINATGTGALGISAAENVNINGGTLTINSKSDSIFAGDIPGETRSITITNGQVSADNKFVAGPVGASSTSDYVGTITLGLKDSSGYIKAGGYTAKTVKIADNQTLFNEDGTESYSGTITSSQIANKKLILHSTYLCNYVDENGTAKSVYATPITTSTTTLTDGWYVVSENTDLTSTLSLSGNSDVNIILADGATLNIGTSSSQLTSYGLHDSGIHNLRIYGQENQTGTLNIYARYPINVGSSFTQNGGKVILSASGNSQEVCGIYAEHTVNINNGTLNITVSGAENSHAVLVGYNDHTTTIKGGITISGGTVTVTGADLNTGSEGTITLGYRKNTDSITAASYTAGTVKVADGQAFYYVDGTDTVTYSGTLTPEQITAIAGQTLKPYQVHTISYDYALSDDESLLSEGYIMVISFDEAASDPSLQVGGTAKKVVSLSGNMYMTVLETSDLSASNFTLKATSGTTPFIFVSENPADDLAPGSHDIRLNSKTTKGTYVVIAVNAGDLNPGAYATSALPLKLANPTRKGYTFKGWTGSNGDTPQTSVTIAKGSTEDLSYTANWTLDTYTITYKEVNSNPDVTSYTIYTDTFTLNNPTKDNYTFVGWKGTGLDGAVKSVTIPKGSTGNREYTAVWQESFKPKAEGQPEIAQHAMILGSQIVVMFYVYFPENYTPADYTMSFDVSGDISENPKRIASTESIKDGNYTLYGYPCYVNSIQMADTIHAALCDKDGKDILTEDYTAKTYLDRVIASADVFSSATVNLCKAIKDYGHYVQIPLAAENKWEYGVKHKTMDAEDTYTTDDVLLAKQGAADYALSKTIDETGLKEFTYALYLDSKTTLQVILTPEEGKTITDLACTYSDGSAIGDSLSIDKEANTVTIADISAHELGNFYKITGKATSEFTITISPLSYVHSVLTEDKTEIDGMEYGVTSLYNYYYRTMKYRLRHSSGN